MKRNMYWLSGFAVLTALVFLSFNLTNAQYQPDDASGFDLPPPETPMGNYVREELPATRDASLPDFAQRGQPNQIPRVQRTTPAYKPAQLSGELRRGINSVHNRWALDQSYRMAPNRQQIEVAQLRQEILQLKDSKEREDRLAKLQSLLEESFDEGIKAQGDELAALEKRVTALKKAFERRKTNRDRVISNYVDSVRLQAEGLTIPALGNDVRRQNRILQPVPIPSGERNPFLEDQPTQPLPGPTSDDGLGVPPDDELLDDFDEPSEDAFGPEGDELLEHFDDEDVVEAEDDLFDE